MRKFKLAALVSPLMMAAVMVLAGGCGDSEKPTGPKLLIIGFDGMDAGITKQMMDAGELPNFSRLAERGSFSPLISSIPAQSPVAWSNFTTGSNPGKHGIYDFIHRNPEKYSPYLSTSEAKEAPESKSFVIGRRVIWTEGGTATLLRHGKPFWEYLADKDIRTRIFKVPSNFPPYKGKGWSTSGMGTPDLTGSYGTFTYFTDNPPEHPEEIGGGTIVPVYPVANTIKTRFEGPPNTYALDAKTPYRGSGDNKRRNYAATEVPVNIYIDPENPQIKIEYQDQEIMLAQGEWSGWHPIVFEMWPGVVEANGIVRFYLKQVRPDFKLYASPINMDPFSPPIPVSEPPEYAVEIAEANGYFYTQGMPEDTKARQADLDILDDMELFHQMMLVYQEDLNMFRWHLDQFKEGVLFYYFSSLDQGTHMFWRLHDSSHPAYDAASFAKMGDPVAGLYKKMDYALGIALEKIDAGAKIIAMSDHGFGSWDRSFQVNTWLLDNGYLKLNPGLKPADIEYFYGPDGKFGIDWSRTSAYGLGINGLYVNLAGREKYGAISPSEKKALIDELAAKLEAYVDPATGEHPIKKAYKSYEEFEGDYTDIAPDIIMGFKRKYRGGDDSALGKFPEQVMTINESSWSGDHCVDPTEVPGIIVTNFKIEKADPALIDIGPTALKIFGQPIPESMDGKPIY